jgi:3-methyladenine DNA glycosylase Tag
MKDTSERIVRITEELRALAAQLQWSTFQKSSRDDKTKILNGVLNSGLVEDLKTALDQLSRFLWCYVNSAAAANSIMESDYESQNQRLGQITEMLRLLREPAFAADHSMSFVDRLTAAVDQHLEAHGREELFDRRSA